MMIMPGLSIIVHLIVIFVGKLVDLIKAQA